MQLDLQRTIVAVSSPLASAQRAIVRVSGRDTVDLLRQVIDKTSLPSIATAQHPICFRASIDLDWFGRCIDSTIYLWPNDRSFTGEPCAELHFLGAMPIVSKIVQRLTAVGASPANRGEFALRSFLAGKLDLVQAEAILGVIESTRFDQLQWALSQLGGNISQPVRRLRAELMELLAHLEAGLDFVEEDIEFITNAQLSQRLTSIVSQIEKLADQLNSRGATNRDFELALVGLPNAGKSSLYNSLLGRHRTIVSETAGTTRDSISSKLELEGVSINLIDTAGLEEISGSTPRALAQVMLKDRIQTCDAVLLCIDLQTLGDPSSFKHDTQLVVDKLQIQDQQLLTIGTKADLYGGIDKPATVDLLVSVHDADSIELLRNSIRQLAQNRLDQQFTQATHHTAVRCRQAFQHASQGLARALVVLHRGEGEELVASELHFVLDSLASIIGEVHNDDILGEIFSRFCIGK